MNSTPFCLPALRRLLPLVALLAALVARAQTFTGIGDPPAGGVQTTVKAISADGSSVAGVTTQSGFLSLGLSPDQGLAWTGDTVTVMGYPPGAITTVANLVSADGTVFAGESETPVPPVSPLPQGSYRSQAFRWTAGYGMRLIPFLPGGDELDIAGISADGSVLAGAGSASTGVDPSGNPTGATYNLVRWTEAEGTVNLGFPDGWHSGQGTAISADGRVIAGNGADQLWRIQAFIWTESDGFIPLGYLPGAIESEPIALSADGSTVVGTSSGEAFRWSRSGGMQGLGGTNTIAVAVSADGRTVAVVSNLGGSSYVSYRWTPAAGLVPLGSLPGGSGYCYVTGMSASGGTLVGNCDSAAGLQAFVWTPAHGLQSLADVLANSYHLDVAGWKLTNPRISADGQTIAGDGVSPSGQSQAWKASIQW
jgi:uncharacterized membrane protein